MEALHSSVRTTTTPLLGRWNFHATWHPPSLHPVPTIIPITHTAITFMKDRVKQIQDHYKLSQKQFAAELGVAEATISSVYRGRTAPTNNLIQAVHTAYPAVNVNWLMFGEGNMLLPLTPETAVGIPPSDDTVSGMGAGIGQNVGFQSGEMPSLFDAPAAQNPPANAQNTGDFSALPTGLQIAELLSKLKNTNEVDKPVRKIKEIRVFFDDGTFEAFIHSSK